MSLRVLQSVASVRASHGGTSRSVPALCDALQERGNDVHLVTDRPERKEEDLLLPVAEVSVHFVAQHTRVQRWLRSPLGFRDILDP